MIQVRFSDCVEIRMGSPYQDCQVTLIGDWIPILERTSWLHIRATSEDNRKLALAAWDILNNEPGFRIIIIDSVERKSFESEHLPGCCDVMDWNNNVIHWKAYQNYEGEIYT